MSFANMIKEFIQQKKDEKDTSQNAKIDIVRGCKEIKLHELSKFESNCNVFRRHYVYIDNIRDDVIEMEDIPFPKFTPPAGMTKDEVLIVMSYISKRVEREHKINPKSLEGVQAQVDLLDTYYFKKLDEHLGVPCIELFTLKGREKKLLSTTPYAEFYFDWYNDDITTSKVQEIYKRLNLSIPENNDFYDFFGKDK